MTRFHTEGRDADIGISVIIPNYNGGEVLKRCLISLLNQSFDKNKYEIIVVDNASKDRSIEIIREFAKKYPFIIRVILLPKNMGYGRAVNIGALFSKFNLILVTNNDIIFYPKYLENLFNTYMLAKSHDRRIVAAQGLHLYYPEITRIYNAGGQLSLISGRYRFYGAQLSKKDFEKVMMLARNGVKGFSYVAFANGAGALIEKDVFLRVGGFYRLYFSGIEEVDLGILLHLLGYRVIFIPSSILYHMEGYTLGGRSLYIPHKLYLIITGLYIQILSLYNTSSLIQALLIYFGLLASLPLLSFLKGDKSLVHVFLASSSFIFKATDSIKKRRGVIMSLSKEKFSEVVEFLKCKNKYIDIMQYLASLFIRRVLGKLP